VDVAVVALLVRLKELTFEKVVVVVVVVVVLMRRKKRVERKGRGHSRN
jgi:hypothetical protein